MSIPFLILAIVFLTMYLSADNNTIYMILTIVFAVLTVTSFTKERKDKEK